MKSSISRSAAWLIRPDETPATVSGADHTATTTRPSVSPAQTSTTQGLFSGRNAPDVVNGLRQELPCLSVFAGLTAPAALASRLLQPRRKRPDQSKTVLAKKIRAAVSDARCIVGGLKLRQERGVSATVAYV